MVAVAGLNLTYQLGRVRLAAFDNDGRWLPPAWMVAARCWHYHENAPPPLLGLTSPFLTNGRRLRHAASTKDQSGQVTPEWWLEDPGFWPFKG